MVMYCVVSGCPSKASGLFNFPKTLENNKYWIVRLQLGNDFVSKSHHRVCHKHFLESDLISSGKNGRRGLKPGALPLPVGGVIAQQFVIVKPWTPKFYFSIVHQLKTSLIEVIYLLKIQLFNFLRQNLTYGCF
jgi:hypothetical protein